MPRAPRQPARQSGGSARSRSSRATCPTPLRSRARCRACLTLYHVAADYRLWAKDPQELYRANDGGTENILAAAARAGVAKVVYTSSVAALGLTPDGSPATETTPVAREAIVGHYKKSKYDAERVAEAWAGRGLPVVIVNPSTPVGELDIKPTPTGQMIVDFLNRRMPAYVDTGLNLSTCATWRRGTSPRPRGGRSGSATSSATAT